PGSSSTGRSAASSSPRPSSRTWPWNCTRASREQFDRPIGGFQLTQAKLADMAVELHKGILLAHHLGRAVPGRSLSPGRQLGRGEVTG
ncbi:hypothetical protein EAO76_17910, partial [Streptomyces sp. sk2.1]